MSWEKFLDEVGTDADLTALDSTAVQAIIDLLALVVYADNQAGMLERSEFRDQIHALPWLEGKDADSALDAAKAATDAQAWASIVDGAAAVLVGKGVGEQVYRMCAELAWVDCQMHRNESAVLALIAKGIEVSADAATAIDAAVS